MLPPFWLSGSVADSQLTGRALLFLAGASSALEATLGVSSVGKSAQGNLASCEQLLGREEDTEAQQRSAVLYIKSR